MRRPESHSRDNLRIRSGIFYFLCFCVLLEGARQGVRRIPAAGPQVIFSVDSQMQATIDSLKRVRNTPEPPMRRMNPNHLDDYTGYRLGLTPAMLDSLYSFREAGGSISDLPTLIKVTGMAPALADSLRVYLYFPKPKTQSFRKPSDLHGVSELNLASARELQEVMGIGPVLSNRILKFRAALGGFLHESQLLDVYGLDSVVALRAMKRFRVMKAPAVEPLNINSATRDQLASLLYISPRMAADIVAYRRRNGPIRSAEQLAGVESIPKDKIGRIALYLQF